MKVDVPRLVIAAPASGSDKTTVTMGLIAALAHNSFIQALKVGPDYIDPGYHTAASGRPALNLDTWMVSPFEWLDRPADAPAAYQVAPRSGQEPRAEGFAHSGLLASYEAFDRLKTAEQARLWTPGSPKASQWRSRLWSGQGWRCRSCTPIYVGKGEDTKV